MNGEIDYKALNIDPDILSKAWDGDAVSQLLLGKAYFNAVYVKDNCLNAFKWFHRSAEQDNMEAQFRLADLFALGQGTPKSYTKAYKWYTKAALQGYQKALIRIFNLYQQDKKMHCRGKLNLEEDELADPTFLKINNSRELNEYRLKYRESKLNRANAYYTELFNMLKSGNQEDPSDSLKLGLLYQYGYGVKKCIKLAMDYYREAASQGSRDAQYHLGYLYENETDIKFNYYFALRWYRVSATSGNTAAQNALGYLYEKGLATELNFEGAIYWYTKAANAGNSDAQLTLGKLYRKGEGVDMDIYEAINWYTLAANQENGAAQNCLNQLYKNRKKNQISDTESNVVYVREHQIKPTLRSKLQDDIEKMNSLPHIKQLEKLTEHALRTDRSAMFTLGMKYYNGEDFSQDKEIGFQWIKRAAKAGLQKAELKVAEMYKTGVDVVDQDFHEASIRTTKLVKQRNDVAQCNLGVLYLSGNGVRKDPLEASKWFTKSADQGNAEAQYQFGLLRYEGLGLRKDVEEAVKWFHKSVLNGNKDALYELGKLFEEGEHVDRDIGRAIKLYKYSASNGNRDSQVRLAEIYEEGELTDQNLQKAETYFILAAISNPHNKYELAKKYMEGTFGKLDYIKALEQFRIIAAEEPSSRFNIFKTPIPNEAAFKNYEGMLDMFKQGAKRGEEGICYNIGYIYENGIYNDLNQECFSPNLAHSGLWYSLGADNGDFRAAYRLGVLYEEGKGVELDLAVAYDYYLEAYENGIVDAAYRLALMYMKGECVAQDLVKAYYLLTEASNKGHRLASTKLTPSDSCDDNFEMLEAVADAGFVAVQYQLGVFYQDKGGNNENAIKWLTLASEEGVTDASFRLGTIYEELLVNDQNRSRAIQLYLKAVAKEHEDAMYRLAQLYHLGKGAYYDYQKAYDLYSRAADLGHDESTRILDINNDSSKDYYPENDEAPAVNHPDVLEDTLLMIKFLAITGNIHLQHQLGTFYIRNKSHLNYKEAFKWYQMAASSENADSIYQLGLLYEKGQGIILDHRAAYHLYCQAKKQGHKDAIYRLGIAYQYGLGTAINTSEVIDCYTTAAELGSDESQYKLGKLCISGELVGKDLLKALNWYTKAYLLGNCEVNQDLYLLYDEKPIESYFYNRLIKILSNFDNIYISDEDKCDSTIQQYYGFVYCRLGMLYRNGQGTAENHVKALKHFLKSYYNYGYKDAEPFISLDYNPYGQVSHDNYLKNLEAYFEIQNELPSDHQYKLGMLYYNGVQYESTNHNQSNSLGLSTVLAPNYGMSLKYFKKASLNNHPKALEKLAIIHIRGDIVEKDYQKGIELFSLASKKMKPEQCRRRGLDFYYGRKVEQSFEIAEIYRTTWTLFTDDYIQNDAFIS